MRTRSPYPSLAPYSQPSSPQYSGAAYQQAIKGLVDDATELGFAVIFAYFFLMPPLLARTRYFSKFYARMGFIRYMVFANLLLWMAALPIKMVLRWTVNLKYIVGIPEWFFNI